MSIEKNLEKNLREKTKNIGGLALKFYCLSFTGFPDRMILLPRGRIHFVELKDAGKSAKDRQALVHRQLRKLGFMVWVINSPEGLKDFFEYVERE